jgi:hypothetical protein
MVRTMTGLALVLALATAAAAQDAEPKKVADSYVKIEAKGKLATGIMAIGGETTGVQLRTDAGTFELDIDKKVAESPDKWDGKTVIVTGTLYVKKGVTRGQRTIVKVATLKEAK